MTFESGPDVLVDSRLNNYKQLVLTAHCTCAEEIELCTLNLRSSERELKTSEQVRNSGNPSLF